MGATSTSLLAAPNRIRSKKKANAMREYIPIINKSAGLVFIVIIICLSLSCCKDNPSDGQPPNTGIRFNFRLTDFEPAWSPDGHSIAYVHGDTVNGQTGIWLIDTNGTNKRIFYSSASAYSPAWSPDGQWIAFSDQAQIWKLKINGDSLTQLTSAGRNFFPDWSPDGMQIAYDSNVDDPYGANIIRIMKDDGTAARDISQHGVGEWRMPNWSPDGRFILHQRYVGVGAPEIFTMDTLGNNPAQLTHDNSFDNYPKYSSDGTKIAFTSQPYGGKNQIWVMNSDGTNLRQLTTRQGYSCDWSPSGDWIVYTDSDSASGRLWLMRSDGSENHQLTF